jgi:hypothetical protein
MTNQEKEDQLILHQNHRAAEFILAAQVEFLKGAILEIFQRIGLTDVNGLPLEDWMRKSERDALEKHFLDLEDFDPQTAAEIQAYIDSLDRDSSQT